VLADTSLLLSLQSQITQCPVAVGNDINHVIVVKEFNNVIESELEG